MSIGGGTGTITFSSSFAIPASSTVSYTLIGDVANLYAGHADDRPRARQRDAPGGDDRGSTPSNATHTADAVVFQVSGSNDDSFANESADDASEPTARRRT